MMSRLSKGMILGLLTGAVGLALGLVPFGFDLEENVGLDLLFNLRGAREPPTDVAVVTIDKESAYHLTLPDDPRKWPRSYHARLIENLVKQGAAVIAFDLNFTAPQSTEEDRLFSKAIGRAGNVVLGERLKREEAPLTSKGRLQPGMQEIESLELPVPP